MSSHSFPSEGVSIEFTEEKEEGEETNVTTTHQFSFFPPLQVPNNDRHTLPQLYKFGLKRTEPLPAVVVVVALFKWRVKE